MSSKPKDSIFEEGVKPRKKVKMMIIGRQRSMKDIFGTLKFRKSTQAIMKEINEGYD